MQSVKRLLALLLVFGGWKSAQCQPALPDQTNPPSPKPAPQNDAGEVNPAVAPTPPSTNYAAGAQSLTKDQDQKAREAEISRIEAEVEKARLAREGKNPSVTATNPPTALPPAALPPTLLPPPTGTAVAAPSTEPKAKPLVQFGPAESTPSLLTQPPPL